MLRPYALLSRPPSTICARTFHESPHRKAAKSAAALRKLRAPTLSKITQELGVENITRQYFTPDAFIFRHFQCNDEEIAVNAARWCSQRMKSEVPDLWESKNLVGTSSRNQQAIARAHSDNLCRVLGRWEENGINPILLTITGLIVLERGHTQLGKWMVRTVAISGEPLAVQHAALWALNAGRPYRANEHVAKFLEKLAEGNEKRWQAKILQGQTLMHRGDLKTGFGLLKEAMASTEAFPTMSDDPFTRFVPRVMPPWKAVLDAAKQLKYPADGAAAVKVGALQFDDPDAYREFAEHRSVERYSEPWREYKSKAAQAGDAAAAMDLAEYYLVASGLYPMPTSPQPISSRQRLKRTLGIEWLRLSVEGEPSRHMKAKKGIFLAFCLREEGEEDDGTTKLENVLRELKDVPATEKILIQDRENAWQLLDRWSSTEDLQPSKLILEYNPTLRLRNPATEERLD